MTDAVIIGGGHNGLVCAAYLAKAGRKVVVCEARARPGGAAATEEIHPGYRAPACAHILHLMHPKVIADLGLARHGLDYARRDLATISLLPDGGHLTLSSDAAVTRESLAQFSARDAERYPAFRARMMRLAGALRAMLLTTPPSVKPASWGERFTYLKLGLGIRRLGRDDMRELLRIIGMNAADLLDDNLESDALKGVLAFDSVLGHALGPRSPNTVFNLLFRAGGEAAGKRGALAMPKGGMGAVGEALAAAVVAAGGEVRIAAPVERVLVENGRAVGVGLVGGEEIRADVVISNADPKRTLLDLVGPDHLDTGVMRRVRNLRTNGVTAKVNLALDGLPDFAGLGEAVGGARLVIAPTIDDVERAFDDAKYGDIAAAPPLEVTVPSLADPTLAPQGGHVVSVLVQSAPYRLAEGDWDARRDELGDRVVAMLATHAPGLAERIVARQVVTPLDLERDYGMTGGHWHHGEMGLDTVFMLRPFPGAGRYRLPVPGLYLCGAGAHPGGGVMGAAGANAAREVIADLGERSAA